MKKDLSRLLELSILEKRARSEKKKHAYRLEAGIIRQRLADLNKDTSIKLSN